MKIAITLLLAGLTHTAAYAADSMTIIDVRRNITLANDEEPYKDFYITGGDGSGLKKNLVVTAVRKINIRDAAGANSFGEIAVPVGQLKIIAVYDKIAVAREFTLLSRDELPMLEQIGIMTGDKVDLRGSFIDTSKPKPKRKVAAEDTNTITTTTITTVTTTMPANMALPKPVAAAAPAPAAPPPASPVTPAPAVTGELAKDLQASATPAAPEKVLAQAPVSTGEKLEKVADSGNTSGHE